ncbi:MAG: hypothetical protein MI753_06035 [Hyphomicrobiales bacterium]|nr:hypothetical protein [Hyphomicrobiales bacterium]
MMACIDTLDAVVAVDSVPLHLAGAPGKPAVALITDRSKWQWAHKGGQAHWYPTAAVIPCPTIFPGAGTRDKTAALIREALSLV